jgi:hypothetical protein
MYITVRRYQIKPGSIDEVVRSVSEGFGPLISIVQTERDRRSGRHVADQMSSFSCTVPP